MKKILLLILNIILFSNAGAEEIAPAKNYELSIAFNNTQLNYEEPGLMEMKGRIYGFDLMAKYFVNTELSILAQYTRLSGFLNYDGSLMNGTPISFENEYLVDDYNINIVLPNSVILGFGKRNTYDYDDPVSADYRRIHFYNYLNLESQHNFILNEHHSLKLILGYQYLLFGNVKSYLSDVDDSYPDLDMKFLGGASLKLGLTYFRHLENGKFFSSLEYKKWSLNQSETQTKEIEGIDVNFYEPSNSTTTFSFTVGWLF